MAMALCLGAAQAALAQAPPTDVPLACTGRWSPPVGLRSAGGFPVYVERGVITPLGGRSLVLGTPTFFWLGRDHMWPAELRGDTTAFVRAITRAGVLVDSLGVASPVPPVDSTDHGSFRREPVLVAMQGDRATIAWEVAEVPTDRSEREPTRIEVATFDGSTWSAPEVVLRAGRVKLHPAPAKSDSRTGGTPVIVAVVRDSSGPALALVHRRGERWAASQWDGAWYLPHASATSARDGSATVIFMGGLRRGPTAGVYALRADVAGDTVVWSEPLLIAAIEARFAQFSSARLGGDSLLVAWMQASPRDARGELHSAVSADAGRSWSLIPPASDIVGIESNPLVVDASGGAHVIFRAPGVSGVLNAPGLVMHSALREGRWTKPAAISADPSVTAPAAGLAPSGRLMAVWTEAVDPPGLGSMPRSLVSFWTPGCSSAAR